MNCRNLLLIATLFLLQFGYAQNKYALLIGVNKYQLKKEDGTIGIDSANALTGCVNDAKSIKDLIVKKFGFKSSNIKELYDFDATKNNILTSINSLLKKSKSGDIVVIFYAGHGSTFNYGNNNTQTAEYILPSDGFSNYRWLVNGSEKTLEYSLIQTSQLASLFNKFVDKKVTLTALFDCCYSKGTIGVKKTIRTTKLINGVPKVLSTSFWESKVEMMPAPIRPKERSGTGLILYTAKDSKLKNNCSDMQIQEAVTRWLNENGYAYADENYPCYDTASLINSDTIIWTNDFNPGNWEQLCGKTKKIKIMFTAKDECNHSDSTYATFIITDDEKPTIFEPAKDISIANNSSKDAAVQQWLSLHGGAQASDGCSDSIHWTNDFNSTLKSFFDRSGSVLVTFTARDDCGNSDFVRATMTIADEINPVDYRLTAQESEALISLLENLDVIRENVISIKFSLETLIYEQLLKQLDTVAVFKTQVSKKTNYTKNGNLNAIQGTQLMADLVESTDYLMVLLSDIPYREEDQITENMVMEAPAETATDNSQGIARNANKPKQLSPAGFIYKAFDFNPPSLIPNSKFVFMSATNDVQKAKEREFDDGSHGVFTAALLEVYKKMPPGTNINDIFEKVKEQLKLWDVKQTPTLRVSEKRMNLNLIGTVK